MTRNEKLLLHATKAGRGVEIGPSYNPVAPKCGGYNVVTIDTVDKPGLVAKYRSQNVDVSQIEDVDYVWRGESYASLIRPPHDFDWIVASHVIEHTPDLIGFLNDCASILAPHGVLCLAIPDKRYCFDILRPVTALGRIIDAFAAKTRMHTPGSITEYMLNAVSRNGEITWGEAAEGELRFLCPIEQVTAHLNGALRDGLTVDVHAWCFTPSSFRLLVHDLNALGLVGLHERAFFPTVGAEFYVTLAKGGAGAPLDRRELAEKARREC